MVLSCFIHYKFLGNEIGKQVISLLNKVPRVSECLSTQVDFDCPSALNARVPKCPSGARVPKVLERPSVQLPWVPKCSSAIRVPFECPSSALRVTLGLYAPIPQNVKHTQTIRRQIAAELFECV